MNATSPARTLIEALIAFYGRRDHPGDVTAASMLDAVHAELAGVAAFTPLPAPRAIAASTRLQAALPRTPLGATINQAMPQFRWRQNPNYTVANMGAAFMAGYGYVEFAGPKEALFEAPNIRVGLLLLGQGLHYPLHAHPAEEVYHPLTADGLWRRGDEAWRTVPAGHAIHHPPMMPHETKATDRTLIALYCWRGDTRTEARLATRQE